MFAFKGLFEWRDTMCRDEDESDKYVLPKYQLLQISSVLPREMEGILACCNPIPPLVKSNLLELHRIILQAREQPLIKVKKKCKQSIRFISFLFLAYIAR